MEASTTRRASPARPAKKRLAKPHAAKPDPATPRKRSAPAVGATGSPPAAPARQRRTATNPAKVPGTGRVTGPLPPHDDAAFIERLGLIAEESGMPRMAGRVLAWLLICHEPRQSFGEIVDALGASKGSISAMTRVLLQLGLIERVTQGGDRRDFFQLHPEAWTRFLHQRVEMIRRFRDLAGEAVIRLDGPPKRRQRLRAMYELYDWWEQEASAMMTRWDSGKARNPSSRRTR